MLKVKPQPTQLVAGRSEAVWPGDDAVDTAESDTRTWAVYGGRRGLVFADNKEPAIITFRPLVERELAKVVPLLRAGDPNTCAEAFRYGVVSITGVPLSRERERGVNGLTDAALDMLAQHTLRLPFIAAYKHANQLDPELETAEEMETALPWAIGVHILGATFRS